MRIFRKKQKDNKKTLSHEEIYKIMQWLPILVSSVFFIINLIRVNTAAMIVIGICLVLLIAVIIITKKRNISLYKKELIMSFSLPMLVFIISLYSGASYSDDFPLFIAVIALTGLYLEPKFTRIQIVLVDILLVIMYLVHPQKAGGLSQYILCTVCFTLATTIIYQVIKRGRSFIEISQDRLDSIRSMGDELQIEFDSSSKKIKTGTQSLQNASATIARESGEVSQDCNIVKNKVKETEGQIERLNEGVRQFENALNENKNNVGAMNEQVHSVSSIISESTNEFKTIETQMKNIAGIAKQMSDISYRLTILSLNASVESARAGDELGAGFEVIASEMRELSETSTIFSSQVSDAVKELLERVEKTSEKLTGSDVALTQSEKKMYELVNSFANLQDQFAFLYDNIENQNNNVNQIDNIFEDFNKKVSDMHNSSQVNQNAADSIANAMTEFSEDIEKIVKNTQSV